MSERCRLCNGPVRRRDLCHTCNEYQGKHGTDRSSELIARQTAKDIEREILARQRQNR